MIYPFDDDDFHDLWQQWKVYKKEIHNFTYTPKAEQASLRLLSGYDLDFAMQLILDAISNQWKQFHFSNTLSKFKKLKIQEDAKNKSTKQITDLLKKYSS